MTTTQTLLTAAAQACREIAQSAAVAGCATPAQRVELVRRRQEELLRLLSTYVRGQGELYALRAGQARTTPDRQTAPIKGGEHPCPQNTCLRP